MNRKKFLKKCDITILDYQVSDTIDSKGNESIDVILTIGEVNKKEFKQYEVLLTKSDLKFLLSEIEKNEREGLNYLNV